MKDLLGRSISTGDIFIFGGRNGSNGYMAVGKVLRVNERTVTVEKIADSRYRHADFGGVKTVVQAPERGVILEPLVIKP